MTSFADLIKLGNTTFLQKLSEDLHIDIPQNIIDSIASAEITNIADLQ